MSARRIGVMQGRLSPKVGDRIQAFPAKYWREEFATAEQLDVRRIEWTLDQDGIDENPFMTAAGRKEIRGLMARHGVSIPSLTGDCFMQAPFWKAPGDERDRLLKLARRVMQAGGELGTTYYVFPLVDNGKLENAEQEQIVADGFCALATALGTGGRIVIESDYAPARLAAFMNTMPANVVGVNYDIGNSASLGYDAAEEIDAYAPRILNVHVKDRLRGGTTVPLGTGAADLPGAIGLLERSGYTGTYILQTARATDDDHAGAIARYRDMVQGWLERARGS